MNFALDLNLLDWSSTNFLAVCLGPRLYLWNASNGEIHQLLEMDSEAEYVSSVAWLPDAGHIAVGTSTMEVQVLQSTVSFCNCRYVLFKLLFAVDRLRIFMPLPVHPAIGSEQHYPLYVVCKALLSTG